MKKITTICTLSLLAFFSSCHSSVPQPEQTMINVAQAELTDATTAMQLSHSHNSDGHTHTLACSFVIAAQAADASAQSWNSIQLTPRYSPLPKEYSLDNNPYEILGVLHNKCARAVEEMGGADLVYQAILNNNNNTWESFFNLDDYFATPDHMNDALADADTHPLTEDQKKLITDCVSAKSVDEIIAALPASSENKQILTEVGYKYVGYLKDGVESDLVMKYLNSKIQPYLEEEAMTDDERDIVVFLTVLKHSYYCWLLK